MKPNYTRKKQTGIVEMLQQAILSGELPGGTEMPPAELAVGLGVSRKPEREALIILEYQGLVSRLPNNRIRVAPTTAEDLAQLFTLCVTLEADACARLSREALEALISPKQEPLGALQEPIPEELRLHHALCDTMESPFLQKTLRTLTETRIAHAVCSAPAEQPHRAKALIAAFTAPEAARRTALEAYFRRLLP